MVREWMVDLFRHFVFSYMFGLSPLMGGLISLLFFVPWPFLFFPRLRVSGVLLVVLSVVFYGTGLSDSVPMSA